MTVPVSGTARPRRPLTVGAAAAILALVVSGCAATPSTTPASADTSPVAETTDTTTGPDDVASASASPSESASESSPSTAAESTTNAASPTAGPMVGAASEAWLELARSKASDELGTACIDELMPADVLDAAAFYLGKDVGSVDLVYTWGEEMGFEGTDSVLTCQISSLQTRTVGENTVYGEMEQPEARVEMIVRPNAFRTMAQIAEEQAGSEWNSTVYHQHPATGTMIVLEDGSRSTLDTGTPIPPSVLAYGDVAEENVQIGFGYSAQVDNAFEELAPMTDQTLAAEMAASLLERRAELLPLWEEVIPDAQAREEAELGS